MSIQSERGYSIRIALRENRMCISKEVLCFIGKPRYIQLFVNREKQLLFIKGCDTKAPQSFAVPPRVYADTEYKYRMTKAAFAEAIGTFQCWDDHGKYRLYGSSYADRIMRFSFEDAEQLGGDEEV